jgi:hypothetical protein
VQGAGDTLSGFGFSSSPQHPPLAAGVASTGWQQQWDEALGFSSMDVQLPASAIPTPLWTMQISTMIHVIKDFT